VSSAARKEGAAYEAKSLHLHRNKGQSLRAKQGQPLHTKHHSKDQVLSVAAATVATAHLH